MNKKVILISYYDWYEQRMLKFGHVFYEKGYDVTYFISNFDHLTKKKRELCDYDNVNFVDVPAYKKNISIKRMYSLWSFSKKIEKILMKEKPSIVYCIVPPNSLVKSVTKYKHDCKIIFDIIDLWPESMPIDRYRNNCFFKYWQNLRNKYINNADYVITECNMFRDKLKGLIDDCKVNTMYLTRKKSTYDNHANLKMEQIDLCYLGSINHIIDIDRISSLIFSLSQYKPVILHIIGEGESKNKLIYSAKKAGATVHDYGVIYDRNEKQRIFDCCHYGLNIYKENTCIGVTIKSIDYFEYGLPIINSIGYDSKRLIKEYHCGYNLNDFDNERIADCYDYAQRENSRNVFEAFFVDEILEKRIEVILAKIEKENG